MVVRKNIWDKAEDLKKVRKAKGLKATRQVWAGAWQWCSCGDMCVSFLTAVAKGSFKKSVASKDYHRGSS